MKGLVLFLFFLPFLLELAGLYQNHDYYLLAVLVVLTSFFFWVLCLLLILCCTRDYSYTGLPD